MPLFSHCCCPYTISRARHQQYKKEQDIILECKEKPVAAFLRRGRDCAGSLGLFVLLMHKVVEVSENTSPI